VADPEILNGVWAEDNVSVPSSFIANAHNEQCAFYRKKRRFIDKNYESHAPPPLNPPLLLRLRLKAVSCSYDRAWCRFPNSWGTNTKALETKLRLLAPVGSLEREFFVLLRIFF